jgi:hypothetical protein
MVVDIRLQKFKDIHKGERCFIIGNGYSLNDMDLRLLKDEYVFVANWFCLHKDYPIFNKIYYTKTDRLECKLGRLLPRSYQKFQKNENAIFFRDICFKNINDKLNYWDEDKIYYFELDRSKDVRIGDKINTDVTKKTTYAGTSLCDFVLPLVYYMGFSKVYLIGVDANQHLKEHPDFSKAHFYPMKDLPILVQNMMIQYSDGFDPGNLDSSFKCFKELFESDGRHLYNCTKGGDLTVLERVNYGSLINSP